MKPLQAIVDQGKTENWARYRLFGYTLASNHSFDGRLPNSEEEIDLFFALVCYRPISSNWENTPPTYISPRLNRDGDNILTLYTLEEYLVIHYPGVADFYLFEQGVVCHLLDPIHQDLATIHILPAIISVWLELNQELFALHASAVIIEGQAIGFLGDSGHGKSTLAAAFTQAGYPLLTDDILLVGEQKEGFQARPGDPTTRLWMNEAAHFIEDPDDLEIIQAGYEKRRVPIGSNGFGSYSCQIAPLACIYVLQRHPIGDSSTDISIEGISPRDAVIELIRLAYSSRLSETIGRSAQRLEFFARLAKVIPLRRLAYPSNYSFLPTVRSAILKNRGHTA